MHRYLEPGPFAKEDASRHYNWRRKAPPRLPSVLIEADTQQLEVRRGAETPIRKTARLIG